MHAVLLCHNLLGFQTKTLSVFRLSPIRNVPQFTAKTSMSGADKRQWPVFKTSPFPYLSLIETPILSLCYQELQFMCLSLDKQAVFLFIEDYLLHLPGTESQFPNHDIWSNSPLSSCFRTASPSRISRLEYDFRKARNQKMTVRSPREPRDRRYLWLACHPSRWQVIQGTWPQLPCHPLGPGSVALQRKSLSHQPNRIEIWSNKYLCLFNCVCVSVEICNPYWLKPQ